MEDIAPKLLEAIQKEFKSNLKKSSKTAAFMKKLQEGTATYTDAGDYAEEVGAALAAAFQKNITSEVLPDGKMYFNIADRVIREMLTEDYKLVSKAAARVQRVLNRAAGIGIKPQKAPINEDRIDGFVNKVSTAEQYEDVAWVLDEPVKTFSRSVVDDTLKANVNFQGKSGLSPKIIRRTSRKCCEWCEMLTGVYEYPNVPQNVYHRHERCRCTVDYDPGNGKKRQDVWSKEWRTPEEHDNIESRKTLHRNLTIGLSNDKYDIDDAKISKFLLKPGAKHAKEFFDVGYHKTDRDLLNADIYELFDEKKKVESVFLADGAEKFCVYMRLGAGEKKKLFRTVWIKDTPESKPRLVTAYRRDDP